MNQEHMPAHAYTVWITCPKCGEEFESSTDANMSDPEVAAIVERLMRCTVCDRCKAKLKPIGLPPWESARTL